VIDVCHACSDAAILQLSVAACPEIGATTPTSNRTFHVLLSGHCHVTNTRPDAFLTNFVAWVQAVNVVRGPAQEDMWILSSVFLESPRTGAPEAWNGFYLPCRSSELRTSGVGAASDGRAGSGTAGQRPAGLIGSRERSLNTGNPLSLDVKPMAHKTTRPRPVPERTHSASSRPLAGSSASGQGFDPSSASTWKATAKEDVGRKPRAAPAPGVPVTTSKYNTLKNRAATRVRKTGTKGQQDPSGKR
jgi:hypothetical protein